MQAIADVSPSGRCLPVPSAADLLSNITGVKAALLQQVEVYLGQDLVATTTVEGDGSWRTEFLAPAPGDYIVRAVTFSGEGQRSEAAAHISVTGTRDPWTPAA